jgi:hypothetical protein
MGYSNPDILLSSYVKTSYKNHRTVCSIYWFEQIKEISIIFFDQRKTEIQQQQQQHQQQHRHFLYEFPIRVAIWHFLKQFSRNKMIHL